MTTGFLFALHGRRGKISQANLALIESLKNTYDQPQATGFLEGDQHTLEDGVAALEDQVDELVVVPVLLFAATHVLWDLPKRINASKCPGLKVTFLEPLGTTQAVYDFLYHQLKTAVTQHPNQPILLVAHGTGHFDAPLQQFEAIGHQLSQALQTPVAFANYVGQLKVQDVVATSTQPWLVQPLFLTQGRIVKNVEKLIKAAQPASVFLPTLENQPALRQAIIERIDQR
ncbi:MAG: transcriptional regulator [Lactobacillus sp.]|jgi:sirohydrochlorin ferrochelatase|nr:transcriptional regulator [Lactobacillus sp.]